MPSITADGVVVLVLIACALPLLSRLPWGEFLHEALDQIVAAIQFLEVTYVILTL